MLTFGQVRHIRLENNLIYIIYFHCNISLLEMNRIIRSLPQKGIGF